MSEDKKQITFEGREYTVPVWVEWVARDSDDCVYGYEFQPLQTEWRDSLTKV